MGKVKLTLTIDESIVTVAKTIAKEKQQSLSNIIEYYLATFTTTEKKIKLSETSKLRGIAKSSLSKKTDKQIREMMYKDKYKA